MQIQAYPNYDKPQATMYTNDKKIKQCVSKVAFNKNVGSGQHRFSDNDNKRQRTLLKVYS